MNDVKSVEFEKDLSKRVYQLCIISGMSWRELSSKAGVYYELLNRMEKENTRPIRRTLHKLCKAADVELKDFLAVDRVK